jgi:hypothetical protein
MRQFARVFAPAMTGVNVEWGQEGLTPASDRVPPVFDGERVRVYALAGAITAGTATLRGTIAGREVAFEIGIDPSTGVEGDTIATLAARERIRTLEEEGEYLESRGSLQRRARANSKAAGEIAALGVKYQLASRETSFVAVEHRDTPLEGRAELRRVPVALTSGWGGVREPDRHYLCAPQMAASHMVVPSPMPDWARVHGSFDVSSMHAGVDYETLAPADVRFSREAAPAHARASRSAPPRSIDQRVTPPRAQSTRPLDVLVSLQRADGSWELDGAFAGAVSLTLRRLEHELRHATGGADAARRALATALALEWLEQHAAAERGEWELLAKKAMQWLAASRTEPSAGQGWNGWLEVARRMV